MYEWINNFKENNINKKINNKIYIIRKFEKIKLMTE